MRLYELMQHKITVISGHFGSGKTNVALNLALDAADAGEQVSIADRSRSRNTYGKTPPARRSFHRRLRRSIGIFFMDGQMWLKELGDGVLLSHNPKYPPRPMTDDVRCQGLVLGVCDESYLYR